MDHPLLHRGTAHISGALPAFASFLSNGLLRTVCCWRSARPFREWTLREWTLRVVHSPSARIRLQRVDGALCSPPVHSFSIRTPISDMLRSQQQQSVWACLPRPIQLSSAQHQPQALNPELETLNPTVPDPPSAAEPSRARLTAGRTLQHSTPRWNTAHPVATQHTPLPHSSPRRSLVHTAAARSGPAR